MRRAAKKLPVQTDQLPAITQQPQSSAPKGIPLSEVIKLSAKGLSTSEIAKILGCSQQCISQRLQGVDLVDLKDFRDNKSTHIVHLQKRLLDSLSASDVQKMSPYQRIIGSAILEDKFMPKQASNQVNVLNISMIVQDIDQRIRKDQPQDIVIEQVEE